MAVEGEVVVRVHFVGQFQLERAAADDCVEYERFIGRRAATVSDEQPARRDGHARVVGGVPGVDALGQQLPGLGVEQCGDVRPLFVIGWGRVGNGS